ncbi:hypothetical protein G7075_08865 [Phycicoccus sp. HDW14]|uniref:hypothetical protein n=1 Tax=Phycicoccus sp. HDW14 TaxID=2714941 RepID=UPI0014089F31|nr:hypothetical protein [Phycicoccus sp. HDW14]QIM21215.1 hypothetical protein G7075_08865 [Phycicoccus sp. HDW14]
MSLQTVDAPAKARPSRRSIASGMAWAVPVIAVGAAAPRAAASPCNPQAYTIAWDGAGGTAYTRTGNQSGTATTDPDGAGPVAPVTLSMSSAFTGAMQSGNESNTQNQNFRVSTAQVGGLNTPGLQFEQTVNNRLSQTPPQRSARQTITFTFSEPVVGLTFTMTDIDALTGDFVDMVELSGTFTYAHATTRTTGAGTVASPFRNTQNGDVANTSNNGNVTITYPGAITSFQLTYWNAVTSYSGVDRNQIVTIADMAFSVIRTNC